MKMTISIAVGLAVVLAACAKEEGKMAADKVVKTDAQWREQLNETEYHVTREKGTERPFTGKYWNHKELGIYSCVCCGQDLFLSDTKFDAGCGWPSYFKPVSEGAVVEHRDISHGMVRTEVVCSKCDAHLGHVFPDGPPPTGLRDCINSASIRFRKAGEPPAKN